MMNKKNVIIRAPLLTYSGYGTHSRQIFKWLLSRDDFEINTQIVPWGITPWMINPSLEGGLVEQIMSCSIPMKSKEKFDISFQVILPNEWDPNLAFFNVGISACVETDICNPEWVECCNRMSAIIVPSVHTKKTLENSGKLRVPIMVIAEAYYDAIALKDLPPSKLELSTDFNFLLFGQLTGNNPENDRKNTFYAVKWLCETFHNDPEVGVIIKTNSGTNTSIDRMVTKRVLKQLINEVRKGPYPRVHFLHGAMTPHEIASLYRHPKIKALVSLTRGEGFGLPLLEAATSGLPIIATNWSAHTEFLCKGKWIKLDYDLCEIPDTRIDNNIFMAGSKWANPKEQSVKSALRKFRHSPRLPHTWAKNLSNKLKETNSITAVMRNYDEAVGDILR